MALVRLRFGVYPILLFSSSSGVGAAVGPQQFFESQVGVLLGCRKAFVAQEFLNGTQIRTPVEQVGCKGVAEEMRMDVKQRRSPESIAIYDPLDRAGRQPPASGVQEEPACRARGGSGR